MESLGEYAKKHEYKILILLLRKGYTFVEHTGIYKKLTEEYKLKIYSDEEFKNELRIKLGSAKNVQEIKKWKMIVFDDAIDDGESIKKFFDNISEIVSENLEKAQKTLKDISKVYKNGDGTSYKSKITSDDFIKDLVRRGNIKICAYLVNESNPEWGKKLEAKWGEKITSIINDEDIGHKEQKEKFIKDVTRIIDFLAHTGEIIDPDHLKIEGKFKEPLSYETIWNILVEISNKISGSVYEPDIKYYHPDKKKITIYNLPCKEWISDDIVNPKIIRGNIGSCNYSGLEKRFCERCTKNVKYENICVDCILFEVTKRVILTFIKDYFLKSEVKDKLKNSLDCKWEYLDNKYEKTKITNFVNELCKLFQE
jgi:uncharacterized protein (UPF0332 family)